MTRPRSMDERLARFSQAILFPKYKELPKGCLYYTDATEPYQVKGKEKDHKVLPDTTVIVLEKDLQNAHSTVQIHPN